MWLGVAGWAPWAGDKPEGLPQTEPAYLSHPPPFVVRPPASWLSQDKDPQVLNGLKNQLRDPMIQTCSGLCSLIDTQEVVAAALAAGPEEGSPEPGTRGGQGSRGVLSQGSTGGQKPLACSSSAEGKGPLRESSPISEGGPEGRNKEDSTLGEGIVCGFISPRTEASDIGEQRKTELT